MVCEHVPYQISVKAKWPGSVHDSRIFRFTFMHIIWTW